MKTLIHLFMRRIRTLKRQQRNIKKNLIEEEQREKLGWRRIQGKDFL